MEIFVIFCQTNVKFSFFGKNMSFLLKKYEGSIEKPYRAVSFEYKMYILEIIGGIIFGCAVLGSLASSGNGETSPVGIIVFSAIAIFLIIDGIRRYIKRKKEPWNYEFIEKHTLIKEFILSGALAIISIMGLALASGISENQDTSDNWILTLFIFSMMAALGVFSVTIYHCVGYRDQFKVKKNNKPTAENAQSRVYPQLQNSTPHETSTTTLSKKQKSDIRKKYPFEVVKRDFEILKDSFEISQTTINTETFCMRYKLCMEKALSLSIAYNSGVKMFEGMPKVIETVLGAKDVLRLNFLLKGVGEQIFGAESLKTDKGKINRYSKILYHLEINRSVFEDLEEYISICNKIKERISELSTNQN